MSASRSYGKGAAILSVGIGVTGLVTYAYFALASHSLPKEQYGGIIFQQRWKTKRQHVMPLEQVAQSTYQEATESRDVMLERGWHSAILVTDPFHMRRALWCFERIGLHALPWPAPRTALRADRMRDFLPRPGSLQISFFALHELIGGAYYRMRH